MFRKLMFLIVCFVSVNSFALSQSMLENADQARPDTDDVFQVAYSRVALVRLTNESIFELGKYVGPRPFLRIIASDKSTCDVPMAFLTKYHMTLTELKQELLNGNSTITCMREKPGSNRFLAEKLYSN